MAFTVWRVTSAASGLLEVEVPFLTRSGFEYGGGTPYWYVMSAPTSASVSPCFAVLMIVLLAGLVANYAVCFGLDQVSFAGKPHLLLYGFLGMVACLVTALAMSAFSGKSEDASADRAELQNIR